MTRYNQANDAHLSATWLEISLAAKYVASDTSETASAPKTKMTDSEMEDKIKANLDSDAQLKAANLSVDADAEKNETTISGTVETQVLRARAVALARETISGLILTDKIVVKPRELTREEYTEEYARGEREKAREIGEKIGASPDDAWIHTKIVAKRIVNQLKVGSASKLSK